MSFCPKCGKERIRGAAFCVACGTSLLELEISDSTATKQEKVLSSDFVNSDKSSLKNNDDQINKDNYSKHTQKFNKKYLAIIPLLILLGLLHRYVNLIVGKSMAINEIQNSAPTTGIPANLFGTKWAMSKAQLLSTIPDAITLASGKLMITRTFYDRECIVGFDFQDDMLMIIIITFKDQSTTNNYYETQNRLIKDYGIMSPISPHKSFDLYSTRKVDRYVMNHTRTEVNIPRQSRGLY